MSTSKEQIRSNNLRKVKIESVELVDLSSEDEAVVRKSKVNLTPNVVQKRKVNRTPDVVPKRKVNYTPTVNQARPRVCEWKMAVTRAVQNLKARQTLHIPSWVVEAHLMRRTSITMYSASTMHTYECTILNPGRGMLERYIGDGWYDFLLDHKPKVGDVLHFAVKSPKNMVVELIRRKNRSR